jgi:hypothetical protein
MSGEGFSNWEQSNELRIAGKRHGKGASADAAVYSKTDSRFESVTAENRTTKDDRLILKANPAFCRKETRFQMLRSAQEISPRDSTIKGEKPTETFSLR